ncbi:thiamine-phosphate kinase [Hydrogenophaga sp. SL48]|uniref:thiamine-phosphate kinase n=1 Tax=Hydrogenophaga sp. SL48 TaxID=2806347 RepID=UPI001F006BA1|nr:thiamine-phosphate kinase [Hydrogenophaga sp. SL48]UJW80918.1 thiamine-phosphate kinase [Hydrogenophaga sp. SL48]
MGEFELIRRHFQRAAGGPSVALGIGDDCALLNPSPGHQLAISSDMLVEGRHFFPDVHPQALGHKALAVNLSDLAAMGARPLGFTLALALPHADEAWLRGFSDGLLSLADAHACPLVGGDTTRGPLNICITVFGEVLPGRALRRDAARPGDDLYLSGRTGEARLALERQRGTPWASAATPDDGCRDRLERPTPRLTLGRALAGLDGWEGRAPAAIDLSDGLAGDLGHILRASGVGAEIRLTDLPVAPPLRGLPEAQRLECLLHGGDDYELLFTAPPSARDAIAAAGTASQTPVQRIGTITPQVGLRLIRPDGVAEPLNATGFDHFT